MRNPSLDVLRAVAIILVFCYHSEGAVFVSRFGWAGVDLFFVLSGFLVSGLLFREYQATQQIRPGQFLLRRGLKIYPQFYFFIAASLVFVLLQGSSLSFRHAAAELAFVQNYWDGIWSHTWSLGVEEHFYLILTLVITILARNGGSNPFHRLPAWIVATCLLILGLRIFTWKTHPQITTYLNVFPTHLRIDSLLIGVLISYYRTFHESDLAGWMRRVGGWLPQVSILFLSPLILLTREDPFMVTLGFSLVSWGFALMLLSVLYPVKRSSAPSYAGRAMAGLGRVSYAFYLWHAPILVAGEACKRNVETHGIALSQIVMLPLTFSACLMMAFATTWWIEIPVLRWRDRSLQVKNHPSTNLLPLESV